MPHRVGSQGARALGQSSHPHRVLRAGLAHIWTLICRCAHSHALTLLSGKHSLTACSANAGGEQTSELWGGWLYLRCK